MLCLRWLTAVAVAAVTVLAPAAAHPHDYPSLEHGTQTTEHLAGLDYVAIHAGHLAPDGGGNQIVWIVDAVTMPTMGYYCQDLNDDGWCGGNPSILPPAPYGVDSITDSRGEPFVRFCGGAWLQSPLSLGYKTRGEWDDPVNFGGNWDAAVDTYVFLDRVGPIDPPHEAFNVGGTNVLRAAAPLSCGQPPYATLGYVDHA